MVENSEKECQKIKKIRSSLEDVYWQFDSIKNPIFATVKGIRGAPIRHLYMNAAIWYLTSRKKYSHFNLLEIGSYVGSSLFTWVQALNKYTSGNASVYSVDPLDSCLDENDYTAGDISKVTEIEKGVKFDFAYQVLRHNMKYMPLRGSCVHIRSISDEILPILRSEMFDLIYIDGNHGYKGVLSDLKESKRLLKQNGILCGDDLEIQGDECDLENARKNAHLDFVVDPKTNVGFHPGVTLAIWETIGKVSSWDGFWAMQLDGERWKTISLNQAPLDIPSHFPKTTQDEIKNKLRRMRILCDRPSTATNYENKVVDMHMEKKDHRQLCYGEAKMPQKFLVTTPGLSATRWLSFALSLHPEVFVSHGKHPFDSIVSGQFAREKKMDDVESFTQGNKMAHFYNHTPLNGIFERFAQIMPEARAIGNVHAFTIEHLFKKVDTKSDLKGINIINVMRHPVNYIASHFRLVLKASNYPDLRHHYYSNMFTQARYRFPELELFNNIAPEKLIPFAVSCFSIYNLANDLGHPEIRNVRMEDLVGDAGQLRNLCQYLTGLTYDEKKLQRHISNGAINKHNNSSRRDPWVVYQSWEIWQKDLAHMIIPQAVIENHHKYGYDVDMLRLASGSRSTNRPKDSSITTRPITKKAVEKNEDSTQKISRFKQPSCILDYTPLGGKSPQEAFDQGNYVGVAFTRQSDLWQTYASLGLIGKTQEAVDGLEKFNCKEATFYQGVAHWIGGEDDKAINCLEMVDTEHSRRLLALIKKERIKVLAQLPWARYGSSDFLKIQNPDPKFEVQNISFHPDDLANRPYADIKSYLNADDPPDFYICKMIEWHVIPPNIQDLPCPIFGHTGDYDLHIQAVYPWLQVFDELLVTDHTEYSDVSKLVQVPVCTFPKSFGIPDGLPRADIGNRPIDGFQSGSTLHPFHPDKMPSLLEMLSLPLEQEVHFFDGFMLAGTYYGLLSKSKSTFTFVRHPGAMPTRGLEALAMGTAVAVQEGSSLSLFAEKNEGVLTYRPDGKGLKQVLEQIIENWPEFQIQAQRGMEMIRHDFVLSKVASQYYRFLTFLAAKPRPERIKVSANDLKQKRMIISKGWLPGDSSVMKKLLAANINNWEKQGRDNFSAGDYIDFARELVLQFTSETNLNPTRDPRKPTPSRTMIRKAMSVFLEGYQRYPDSLPLIFNMLRTAFHFGTPQEVTGAIRLCRQTLDMPEGHWNVDVLEDVFPWDFNSSLFNYRTYFERVNQCLYRKERIGQGLSKLIYASLYSYLSVYENPLKNARLAVQLDPVFCFYKYRLAQLLVAQDKKDDRSEAVCLLTELSHNSILFYDALQLLEKLKRQGKIKTNDMETSCYYSDRMERSNAFAQMNQLAVRNAPWRKVVLQKPESRVYPSQQDKPVGNAFCVRDTGQNTTLQQRVGILIPTLDRPDFLKRTLQYYHRIRFQGQIIVGDSSGPKNAGLNRQTVDRVKDQLDIIYQHYPNPPYLHDGMCMKSMVDLAQTPYVVYSGDDDFLILAGLEKCVGFLDANPDFVAAQGVRINLCLDKKGPWGRPVSASFYTGADYLDDSSTQRLATYLRTGLSIQYYVHRIDIWEKMYRDVDRVPSRYLGPELLPCCLSAILGKKMKLDVLSVVFQKNPNQVFSWEKTSLFDLINNPLWAASEDIVKKSVTAAIVKSDGLDTEKAQKVFDREFWAHINSVLMAQFKRRHMDTGSQPEAESEKILQTVLNHHQFADHLQPVMKAMIK